MIEDENVLATSAYRDESIDVGNNSQHISSLNVE
jgi:hypothetical protein